MADTTADAIENAPTDDRRTTFRAAANGHIDAVVIDRFNKPIEKLIEKYQDPKEVFNHLSIGQLMKYHLDEETGCIYEGERLIFDGQQLVKE